MASGNALTGFPKLGAASQSKSSSPAGGRGRTAAQGYGALAWVGALSALLLLSIPAQAQIRREIIQYYKVQSGTGFFVNRQYVITNAHVVRGCTEVYIKGAVPESKANVRVMDNEADLALIETDHPPQQFAPLRFNIDDLKAGDKVLLLGYPGTAGAEGHFSMATAQIENVKNVQQLKGRFFITDVVEHGNSGGPVFDTSGNVIGVVVAKIPYFIDSSTMQPLGDGRHVGVVIDLSTLKQFLFDHGIFTEWQGSNLLYSDDYIEDNAKTYIVNVQCRTPVTADEYQQQNPGAPMPAPGGQVYTPQPQQDGLQPPGGYVPQPPPGGYAPPPQQEYSQPQPDMQPQQDGTRIQNGVTIYGR